MGKSTQTQTLVEQLRSAGLPVVKTREPGGSAKAEALRALLLSGAVASFGPAAEAILFSAARIDHVDTTIRPALDTGISIVCDRFIDSTRAYQGALGHVAPAMLSSLECVTVGMTRPDLTLILDMPSETGLARARARRSAQSGPDRFEREESMFHEQLRLAFLDIARHEPQRCVVIDASRPPDAVARDIWTAVQSRLLDRTLKVPKEHVVS